MIPFHSVVLLVLLVATACLAFSQPASARKSRVHPDYYNNQGQGYLYARQDCGSSIIPPRQGTLRAFPLPNGRWFNRQHLDSSTAATTTMMRMDQSSLSDSTPTRSTASTSTSTTTIPKFVFRLNASTKWIITILHSWALWSRPHRYEGPLIVLGSIVATYLTQYLKQVINQGRPAGAPFTNPGMPSSHSLISFFIAAAWTPVLWLGYYYSATMATAATTATTTTALLLLSPRRTLAATAVSISLLWMGATMVALLRWMCGYHSWAQISVGAGLGTLWGVLWTTLGRQLYQLAPKVTFYSLWTLYLSGAALFISTNMRDWLTHEKHL